MFGPEFKDLIQCLSPSLYALSFQPVHKICANIGKPAGAYHIERFKRLLRTVSSSQVFKVPVIKGLNTKADAVDAQSCDGFQFIPGQAVGIGFYGHLRLGTKGKMLMEALQQLGEFPLSKKCRRAPTEIE